MKECAVCALALGVVLGSVGCQRRQEARVDLRSVQYDPALPRGWFNVFFGSLDLKAPISPAEWRDVQAAYLLRNDRFHDIVIVSANINGENSYAADFNADGTLDLSEKLVLKEIDKGAMAEFPVTIRPTDDNERPWQMSYQVYFADKYQYARIGEYRKGSFQGRDVELYLTSRNNPVFDLTPDTQFFIDFNVDGEIQQVTKLDEAGSVRESEQAYLSQPFILNDKKWQVSGIDPLGRWIRIMPTGAVTAAAKGFLAPELSMSPLEGGAITLKSLHGKVVLLVFWSVNCGFSEMLRPQLNQFVEKYAESNLEVLAIPIRGETPEILGPFLEAHPYKARVVLAKSESIRTFSPQVATPQYVLIDTDGMIQTRAVGISAFEAVKTITAAIRGLSF